MSVTLDGAGVAEFSVGEGGAVIAMPADTKAPHGIGVSVYDPQVHSRLLYSRSVSFTCAEAAAAGHTRLTFGLDGVRWEPVAGKAPEQVEASTWDPRATTEALPGREWPMGEPRATVSLPAEAAAGTKGTHVIVSVQNPTEAPVRVLAAGLRLALAGNDTTNRFFVLPASALPAAIPPQGNAGLRFRLDSFDDTPSGSYDVTPLVVYASAEADLLTAGGFEEEAVLQRADEGAGWLLPTGAPEDLGSATALGGGSRQELADRVADWHDFAKLSFSNDARVVTQGSGLLEASFAKAPAGVVPVARQTIAGLQPGERYLLLTDSWGGNGVSVELADAQGRAVAGEERNFSGFWWRHTVGNWRGRALSLVAPPDAGTATVSLLAQGEKSWWDNVFLGPESALKLAATTPAPLTLTAPTNTDSDVVYLGEDRQTGGNWVGNYGSHCWILCAMSAPRDMVGGQVKAIKCHHDDMSRAYANETIRVTGEGELRYASWTGDPTDVRTRHWIGVMRSEEPRAPENPQWGYRTYASWDEHGEVHPTDAWGKDLYVRLQMPEGLWRLSLYFIDWDWHSAPYPRAHRLSFLDAAGKETCTARVADFGQGVYKVFGIHGGRDVLLRIRKDFSATVVLSGVFLDRIEPYTTPPASSPATRPMAGRLSDRLAQMAKLAEDDPRAFLRALPSYAEMATWAMEDGGGNTPQGLFGRRVQYELLGRTGVHLQQEAGAFVGFAEALQRAGDAAPDAFGVLKRLGDEAFEAGDLRHAEMAYDATLAAQAKRLTGKDLAEAYRERAELFRVCHPRYAMDKLRECLRVAEKLGPKREAAYLKSILGPTVATANDDYKQGRGLVRVQYALPTVLYRRLEDLLGYAAFSRQDRENLMTCRMRQTWYTLGWEELAAEQERLIADIPEAELKGELITLLVRSYDVLAQSDPAYVDKAARLCEKLREPRPDGDWSLDSYFRPARIYYRAQRWKEARDCFAKVAEIRPGSPEAEESRRMLADIEKRLPGE